MQLVCKFLAFSMLLPAGHSVVYGDVIVDFRVDIVESGPVLVGSTVNWNLFVQASTSDATNFGAASFDVDLTESQGNTLSAGTVAASFFDYSFSNGGAGGWWE